MFPRIRYGAGRSEMTLNYGHSSAAQCKRFCVFSRTRTEGRVEFIYLVGGATRRALILFFLYELTMGYSNTDFDN